jgi:exodeoxyribonuclease VII large subunit
VSEVLTVSALTARIRELLEGAFADVWVLGEISNLTRARSGHVYLTLKDGDATLSGVVWRSTAARLRHELDEGMEVLARGRIVVYPPRGQYQLDIRRIEPRGLGALQAAFEKLKARLAEEGLFDEKRKQPLPLLPTALGIVTSPTGAALRDILKVLSRRFPGVSVLIWPARVQGEGAADEIAAGIRELGERGSVDVLIAGRGGGSLEDLWAFNEEVVARAIAACAVPVISAVGHEVDWTIADFVADVRAPTPSAAAEIAVPSEADLRARLGALAERLSAGVTAALALRRERLLRLLGSYGLRGLPDRLRERAQRLDDLHRRMSAGVARALESGRERMAALSGRLESLSPLRVLARGYSVTTRSEDGVPVLEAARLRDGDRLRTRFSRGSCLSRVEETFPEEESHG